MLADRGELRVVEHAGDDDDILEAEPSPDDWLKILNQKQQKMKEKADGTGSRTPSGKKQVWPPTQFFSVSFFVKKNHRFACKSMTPNRGNAFLFHFSRQLPRLRLGPLKGFLS